MLLHVVWTSLLCFQAVAAPQPAPQKPAPKTHVEGQLLQQVSAWIAQGPHQDIPWKVRVSKPLLTFQQRMVVKATATIDSGILQSRSVRRDLLFIIKVADQNGKWFPGENFVPQRLDSALGRDTDLEMETEVLLKPGKYTLATIVYDGILEQHNVEFTPVEVPDLKNDPLPHLLQQVEQVEFIRDGVQGADSFSTAHVHLPLDNKKPVEVDVLVDLSARDRQATVPQTRNVTRPHDEFNRPPRFKRLNDKSYQDHLLQSASVLGDITPTTGCVRVSAFDAIKKRVELEPTAAPSIDWAAIRATVLGPDRETISISALEGRKDTPKFVRERFDKVVTHPPCEGNGSAQPIHVVIVLSHGLEFPSGSQKIALENCGCVVFYLRQSDTAMDSDDLKGMLSSLSPKRMNFSDSGQFRKKLAQLLEELQKTAQ